MINANVPTFNKTNDEKNTEDMLLDLKWERISEDLKKTISNTILSGMFNILKSPMLFLYIRVTVHHFLDLINPPDKIKALSAEEVQEIPKVFFENVCKNQLENATNIVRQTSDTVNRFDSEGIFDAMKKLFYYIGTDLLKSNKKWVIELLTITATKPTVKPEDDHYGVWGL